MVAMIGTSTVLDNDQWTKLLTMEQSDLLCHILLCEGSKTQISQIVISA